MRGGDANFFAPADQCYARHDETSCSSCHSVSTIPVSGTKLAESLDLDPQLNSSAVTV